MANNYVYILVICIGFAIGCLLYGKYRCTHPDFLDPLLKKSGIWDLDGWSMMHVGQYIILGYLFPHYFYFIMGLGIIWEGLEFYYERAKLDIFKGYGHCTTDSGDQVWWYGKLSDLVCNLVGFRIGYALSIN